MGGNIVIDFVIPCHPKDFPSLKICVNGIRENISCLNRIFVVSNDDPNIEGVIHVPEQNYSPYVQKEKIAAKFEQYNQSLLYRTKWIYQQFLKLFSAKVIPELTESYVMVDSDTIFLRDIPFDSEKFYYCKAEEYHKPYIDPIKRLFGIKETIGFSTISHHMIFNKSKLNEMIVTVEKRFQSESFFECVLEILDYNEASCISEWDLYSNFMILNYPEMCQQRQLIWEDISFVPVKSHLEEFKENFDFVSCHAYRRGIE
jgi:beta-galactosidase beta subunit